MRLQVTVSERRTERGAEGQRDEKSAVIATVFTSNTPSAPSSTYVCLAASEDGTITQWTAEGEPIGSEPKADKQAAAEMSITDAHIANPPDVMITAGGDGSVRWLSVLKAGAAAPGSGSSQLLVTTREDKMVAACAGAAITVKWSPDASAVAIGGEDGSLKVYSRSGMLRTTLVSAGRPIYAVVWSPDGSSLLYASGKDVSLVSLASESPAATIAGPVGPRSGRGLTWKAHDGIVTRLDWSPASGRIISGGEDGKYKVWDSNGRCLFASNPDQHAVTSIAWAPRGDVFAVGSYESLRLCDASGWCIDRISTDVSVSGGKSNGIKVPSIGTGSLMSLAWTPDGAHLAAGCGTGAVLFARLVDVQQTAGGIEAVLEAPERIRITDNNTYPGATLTAGTTETNEIIELREPTHLFAVGYGHLVAATSSHVAIYTAPSWSTAHTIDTPKSCIRYIALAARHFAAVDAAGVLTLYTYDGRTLSTPKTSSPFRPEALGTGALAVAPDVVAFIDKMEGGGKSKCAA
jgi:intraflagellar transport protein 80